MKSTIATSFVLTIFLVPLFVQAQQLGTIGNPLYVQNADPFADLNQRIQQRELLDALNQQTQAIRTASQQVTSAGLQAQYGWYAFASCQGNYSACTGANAAGPSSQALCLQYVQYCLQSRATPQVTTQFSTYTAPSTPASTATYGNIKDTLGYQEITCKLRKNTAWNTTTNTCDCLSGYSRTIPGGDCSLNVAAQVATTDRDAKIAALKKQVDELLAKIAALVAAQGGSSTGGGSGHI